MKHRNTIFSELLKFLPRQTFQKVVDRHKGDKRTRSLKCWDQFVALLFAQLSNRQSLRDLVDSFNSKRSCHYHLATDVVRKSSLADANKTRPSAIYSEVFFYLLEKVRGALPKESATEMVRLIDATVINLNLKQFEWAKFRSTKSGIKLHTVYDPNAEVPVYFEMTHAKISDCKALSSLPILSGMTYVFDRAYDDYKWYHNITQMGSKFVGRMKSTARYEVIRKNSIKNERILSDEVIKLSSKQAQKDCPVELRRITFTREEDNKVLVFITNDHTRSAIEIAGLYKQRWQIELFFKWIKQNLKIKKFIGRSENAVKIQVLVAMIAYLLLKLTQLAKGLDASLQKISRLIGINLMTRISLAEIFLPEKERRRSVGPILQKALAF
tara:strand:+ start:277 stop:1425 length:1149 start_codon:yes stop_codon:yes gene_type:complete